MSAGSANKRHSLLSSIDNVLMIRPVNNLFFIENDLPTLTTARSKHRSNCSKSNYCYLTFHCLPCRQLPSPTNTLKCRWREWNDSQARGGTSAKHLRRLSLRPKNYFSLFFFFKLVPGAAMWKRFYIKSYCKVFTVWVSQPNRGDWDGLDPLSEKRFYGKDGISVIALSSVKSSQYLSNAKWKSKVTLKADHINRARLKISRQRQKENLGKRNKWLQNFYC